MWWLVLIVGYFFDTAVAKSHSSEEIHSMMMHLRGARGNERLREDKQLVLCANCATSRIMTIWAGEKRTALRSSFPPSLQLRRKNRADCIFSLYFKEVVEFLDSTSGSALDTQPPLVKTVSKSPVADQLLIKLQRQTWRKDRVTMPVSGESHLRLLGLDNESAIVAVKFTNHRRFNHCRTRTSYEAYVCGAHLLVSVRR